MHLCCANCALYPVKSLSEKDFSITGFWFNPNIHPYGEYAFRLNAVKQLQNLWNLEIVYKDYYGLKEFIQKTNNGGEDRCRICYEMRLDETAKKARDMQFDAFTTSLLASPYQKFDVIIAIAEKMGRKHSVAFYMEDFRPGWNESVDLSRKLGLYRQKFCGCIYSEMERYTKKPKS